MLTENTALNTKPPLKKINMNLFQFFKAETFFLQRICYKFFQALETFENFTFSSNNKHLNKVNTLAIPNVLNNITKGTSAKGNVFAGGLDIVVHLSPILNFTLILRGGGNGISITKLDI